MLDARTLVSRDGVTIADVACRHGRGRGADEEHSRGHAIVFVRRGCFTRSVNGAESVLDPTRAYCMRPGDEQRYDHPHEHGDDCTAVFLDEDLVAQLPQLPDGTLNVLPHLDLQHRLLLAAARRGEDAHEVVEHALELSAAMLERPRALARAKLADEAREALAADWDRSLPDLARHLAVSPHHLSRAFRAEAGHTLARHRMRLRTRAALERLNGGERNLARLAADLGFADQSHLCRVVRSETGETPSALRRALN